MSTMAISPEEHRAKFVARWDTTVVRLEDQIEKAVKLLAMQMEALENEMTAGMAYKQTATNPAAVKSLRELTASFNSLTDAKIRLDKTAKERVGKMTPAEEREAVMIYLRSLPPADRGDIIDQIVRWHREVKIRTVSKGPLMRETVNGEPVDSP